MVMKYLFRHKQKQHMKCILICPVLCIFSRRHLTFIVLANVIMCPGDLTSASIIVVAITSPLNNYIM